MVPKCTNGWQKTKGTDITYHRLPSAPLAKVGLRNIRRENQRNRSNSFICSVHFTPDCFDAATEICGRKKPRTLKSSTIPTLFAFAQKNDTSCKSRASSLKQIREREVSTRNIMEYKQL